MDRAGAAGGVEVRDLELVDMIIREGSMTRAARRLGKTQSTLSHQLRQLESGLGLALFTRQGKRLIPTLAGERVNLRAASTLEEIRTLEAELAQLTSGRRGVVRLSTECFTCYSWLPPVLAAFDAAHPGVDVRIAVDATTRARAALVAGEIDVALAMGPAGDRRFRFLPLFRDELVAVVSPRHPLADRPFLAPADFAGVHLIGHPVQRDRSRLFRAVLDPAGVTPRRWTILPLTEAIVDLVASGHGVGVLFRWATAAAIAEGRLRAIRITRRGMTGQWGAATMARRRQPEHLGDFLAVLGTAPMPGSSSQRR